MLNQVGQGGARRFVAAKNAAQEDRTGPGVVMVVPAGIVSGKEIVSLSLAAGLRTKGYELVILTSRWGSSELIERLEAAHFKYQRLWLGYISGSLRWPQLKMTLGQLQRWPTLVRSYSRIIARTAPAAVIHTNWHHALLLLPFLKPQRAIYWAHEIIPAGHRSAWVFRLIARRVATIVCVSHAVRDSFAAAGVSSKKLTVIHNGIPSVSMALLRSEGPLRLGIVGQIGDWKGHEDLLTAIAAVTNKGFGISLSIFGNGSEQYVDRLKRRASELGIGDKIEWRGFLRDQANIFGEIDVCIVPSRLADPLPTSAIEASAFGRPVIASRIGGLPEIVMHGETGLLVEPARPEQLADAIEIFARDRSLIFKMGQAGRARAQAEFSESRFVDEFVGVIGGLLPTQSFAPERIKPRSNT